jgi:hypothetical protein
MVVPQPNLAEIQINSYKWILADGLKEQTSELALKWNNEKETVSDIKNLKKQIEEARREADNAEARVDLSKAAEIRYGTLPALEKDLDTKSKRLKKLQSSRSILKEEITENDIALIVSKWTGVPVSRMLEEEADKLSRMEDVLKQRIVGQDEAVQKISDTIKRSRAGIADPNRPSTIYDHIILAQVQPNLILRCVHYSSRPLTACATGTLPNVQQAPLVDERITRHFLCQTMHRGSNVGRIACILRYHERGRNTRPTNAIGSSCALLFV